MIEKKIIKISIAIPDSVSIVIATKASPEYSEEAFII